MVSIRMYFEKDQQHLLIDGLWEVEMKDGAKVFDLSNYRNGIPLSEVRNVTIASDDIK